MQRSCFYIQGRDYESYIARAEGMQAYHKERFPMQDLAKLKEKLASVKNQYKEIFFSSDLPFFSLLDKEELRKQMQQDLPLWLCNRDYVSCTEKPGSYTVLGRAEELYLHKSCQLAPYSVLDTRSGPIVLDAEVEVLPFCYLQGPVYAAPKARLERLRGSSLVLGRAVRAGGEIQNSLIGDFSNKCHEGFLGHSIVGNWVNLGALTTTSNLKNNYGLVRLQVPAKHRPEPGEKCLTIATERMKLASLIGDHVKTAIGSMLGTGTILDCASNVFGAFIPKYLPPFSWGSAGELYELDRFLSDSKKIAARRMQKPQPYLMELAELCYPSS